MESGDGGAGEGPLLGRAKRAGAEVRPISLRGYSAGRKTARDAGCFALDQPALAWRLRRELGRDGADLVYVNGPRVLAASVLAARGRAPVLFHCHSRLSGIAVAVAGAALRASGARVIACSRHSGEPLTGYARPGAMEVIYNGVSAGRGGKERRKKGPLRIGMVGRISPEKGQLDFVDAVRDLGHAAARAEFVLCGDVLFGDRAAIRYEEQVQRRAVGVQFLGWREDVRAVLRSLDLLVAPSNAAEAGTRVIPEAFAEGTPVLAYRSGGIPEIIGEGGEGVMVDPDRRALAEAMRGFLNCPAAERARMRTAALRAWEQRFRLERWREEVLEVAARAAGSLLS